jgi:hypothetical protein
LPELQNNKGGMAMEEGFAFLFGILTGIVLAFIALFRMFIGVLKMMEHRVR